MFTGLVQSLGVLIASADTGAGKRLTVSLGELAGARIEVGDSVCVSGVCLTVAKRTDENAEFDVITETLHCTTLGNKKAGDRVNLELSLRPDSFVGGHFVQGHVDVMATLVAAKEDPRDWRLTFEIPRSRGEVMAYLTPKGSVAVDGVSMTIAEVAGGAGGAASTFTLAVIPTTLEKTTLGALKVGESVNVETDMLARTVVHYLRMQAGAPLFQEQARGPLLVKQEGVTLAKLHELGMA
jgi:riboflavin synthase